MKKQTWKALRFRNYIYKHSDLLIQTDSNQKDMYGDPIGIDIRAIRFGNYAVIIVDCESSALDDQYPEYDRISSIDKLMDDAVDVYYQYGYEDDPRIYLVEEEYLEDKSDLLIKYIRKYLKSDIEYDNNKLYEIVKDSVIHHYNKIEI